MGTDLVFVVHSEAAVAGQVSGALLSAEYKVISMTSDAEAEAAINSNQFILPDVILTPLGDLESGDSILIKLFGSNPLMEQIPVVVLASHDRDQRRRALRLGLLSVIFPPYDQEEVVLTTELAIEKHRNEQLLFGSLSQLSVPDLLQTAEVGRRSGMITIQQDGHKGTVWLRDGYVVNAEVDTGFTGADAVYTIALWETGTFEANFRPIEVEELIEALPSELLLEAMRRHDEGQLPSAASAAEGVQDLRSATSHLALALLNVASSYALNHLDSSLVEVRLEQARFGLIDQHPEVQAFAIASTGLISLIPDEFDQSDDLVAYADGVALWVRLFFERMEAALAWRFTAKKLAHITEPWHEDMRTLHFFDPLGLDGGDSEGEEPEPRTRAIGEHVLPLGCFVLNHEGTIERYSSYGPQLGSLKAGALIGQALTAVLPRTLSGQAEALLADLDAGDDNLAVGEYSIELGHSPLWVRIGLISSALSGQVIATINRLPGEDVAFSSVLERDPELGTLTDGGATRILAANDDFMQAFESLFAKSLAHRRHELLHRFGKSWGLRHVLRMEHLVQRQYGMTLREVESQMAIGLLSSAVGVLGLGRFESDLNYRESGLLVITHYNSPFVGGTTMTEGCCSVLAGFHAALLSYLAARQLAAREISCSRSADQPCRFVIATEDRLTKLLIATPGSPDHNLLVQICTEPVDGPRDDDDKKA